MARNHKHDGEGLVNGGRLSKLREYLNDLRKSFSARVARNVPAPPGRVEGVSIGLTVEGLRRHIRGMLEQIVSVVEHAGPMDLWGRARTDALSVLSSLFDQETAEQAVKEGEQYLSVLSKMTPAEDLIVFRAHRTPYEFWTLYIKQFQIERAVATLGYRLTRRPIMEMLPTGQVNAVAIPIPLPNQYVVVFESGLKPFSNLLCKAVASAWSNLFQSLRDPANLPADDELLAIIAEHRESIHRFQKILLAYLFLGNPVSVDFVTLDDEAASSVDVFSLPDPLRETSGQLERSMDLFAIGHEYGHVLSNHKGKVRSATFLFEGKQSDEVLWNWDQEYEADALGLQLLLEATKKNDRVLGYCGADLFFSLIEVVLRAVSLVKHGKDEVPITKTHPTPAIRRQNLRRLLQSNLSADLSIASLALAGILQHIIAVFFDQTVPTLRTFHSQGKRLAPIWYDP